MTSSKTTIKPSPFLKGVSSYSPPKSETPVDLFLDGNEGKPPPMEVLEEVLKAGPESVRMYPKKAPLEKQIADMVNIDPERVLVTAGADDALERIIRATLAPGREAILPVPTFGMILRYTGLTGCETIQVPWTTEEFPLEQVLAKITDKTSLIGVVTPSSPLGYTVSKSDLEAISKGAPNALLLVDLAYTEFADEDPTEYALSLPNAVVTRSLSKAWGLAGLRVGWVGGPKEVIEWFRVVGHPYAVSSPSITMARATLSRGVDKMNAFVAKVKEERNSIYDLLQSLGASPSPSNGNFIFSKFDNVEWLRDGLAALGVAIRIFPGKEFLEEGARITIPGDEKNFGRLKEALKTVLDPEAIIFDIDDTLVDVSESYRRATVETAREFGVEVDFAEIAEAKARGNANNDWDLTWKLIQKRNIEVSLEEVTRVFEDFYQGTGEREGLNATEKLMVSREFLEKLSKKYKLGIVTGRPTGDAEAFLNRYQIGHLFRAVVTMNDAPLKPDPAPVCLALDKLEVSRAWMVGDTPDDVRAARAAGVVALGVIAPADEPLQAKRALIRAGAGRVLENVSDLKELLK